MSAIAHYDPAARRLVRDFIALNGTTVNCAGGFGRGRESWLTGEETIAGPSRGFAGRHGYLFEVPLDRGPGELEQGVPLEAAGRFSHEAAATDTHPTAPGLTDVNRPIGITPAGEAFEFAVNIQSGSELAGVCFSPDGATAFVNLFGRAQFTEEPVDGMTCAITGPWGDGPL